MTEHDAHRHLTRTINRIAGPYSIARDGLVLAIANYIAARETDLPPTTKPTRL